MSNIAKDFREKALAPYEKAVNDAVADVLKYVGKIAAAKARIDQKRQWALTDPSWASHVEQFNAAFAHELKAMEVELNWATKCKTISEKELNEANSLMDSIGL